MKKIIFLLGILLLVSCNKEEKYVNEVLDIMEKHSVRKDSIDWETFRKNTINQIKDKKGINEMHHIISNTLYELGDNHSFLLKKDVEAKLYHDQNPLPFITTKLIDSTVAYIKIPQFVGNDRLTKKFASLLQREIKELDQNEINNWIVDLRGNTGGNMYSMYLGLSPIFKEGIGGYFQKVTKELIPWKYENNAVFNGDEKMVEIESSYQIKSSSPKIAVLIDGDTGSSGEAIAISFKGFPNTKLFGFKTYGLTTGNDVFELSDGTKLVLTTSTFMDRNKNLYGKQVEPDFYSYTPKKDAVAWLLNKQDLE